LTQKGAGVNYVQNDLTSEACSTRSVIIQGLENMGWAAVFTAECGFFSAARLRHLFPLFFPARIKNVIGRGNHNWDVSYD